MMMLHGDLGVCSISSIGTAAGAYLYSQQRILEDFFGLHYGRYTGIPVYRLFKSKCFGRGPRSRQTYTGTPANQYTGSDVENVPRLTKMGDVFENLVVLRREKAYLYYAGLPVHR